jgi:hypothetical protein
MVNTLRRAGYGSYQKVHFFARTSPNESVATIQAAVNKRLQDIARDSRITTDPKEIYDDSFGGNKVAPKTTVQELPPRYLLYTPLKHAKDKKLFLPVIAFAETTSIVEENEQIHVNPDEPIIEVK